MVFCLLHISLMFPSGINSFIFAVKSRSFCECWDSEIFGLVFCALQALVSYFIPAPTYSEMYNTKGINPKPTEKPQRAHYLWKEISISISKFCCAFFITVRKRSLEQGNVFTRICHSVHRGEGLCPGLSRWQRTPGQRPNPGPRPPPL